MKNSGKQLVGILVILVLLAIVLVVFFCVSNGGNGTSSSNFGALMQYKLTNKTGNNLNVVCIIDTKSSTYGTSDNGSGAQKIVEINVYSADGLDYWYFYYGGSTAFSISKDPANPTKIILNATGGHQRNSTERYYCYNVVDWSKLSLSRKQCDLEGYRSGRYVRIFGSTKRYTDGQYPIALLMYVDGYGNLIDNNDKASQRRSGSLCGNCMPLDPGSSNEYPPRYKIGLASRHVLYYDKSILKTICPFYSIPPNESIPIINNIKQYDKINGSIKDAYPAYNVIYVNNTQDVTISN